MKRNREGYLVGDTERECTSCGNIFNKTSKTVALCNTCNCERVKCTDVRSKMLARAKGRAKDKGLAFNIDITDIVIPDVCPVLGMPLIEHKGSSGGKSNSPALDRMDNSKGYIKGNVMVMSQLANLIKSSATAEQLLMFADWVVSTYRQGSNDPC